MKFKITKRYKLDFLGEGWKDCYLDFYPFTPTDLEGDIAKMADFDTSKGSKEVVAISKMVIGILSKRFLGGKVLNEKGELIEMKKEYLSDLPLEVLQGVVSFLSEASVKNE